MREKRKHTWSLIQSFSHASKHHDVIKFSVQCFVYLIFAWYYIGCFEFPFVFIWSSDLAKNETEQHNIETIDGKTSGSSHRLHIYKNLSKKIYWVQIYFGHTVRFRSTRACSRPFFDIENGNWKRKKKQRQQSKRWTSSKRAAKRIKKLKIRWNVKSSEKFDLHFKIQHRNGHVNYI